MIRSSSDLDPNSKRKEYEISFEPKRSQHERKREVKFGLDFISSRALSFLVQGNGNKALNQILILLNVEEEDPKIFGEAMSSTDASFRTEIVNDETYSIMSNQTWLIVNFSKRSKPISFKWVLRRKYNMDGSIQTFKARLVAKSIKQKHGIGSLQENKASTASYFQDYFQMIC